MKLLILAALLLTACDERKTCTLTVKDVNNKPKLIEPAYDCSCYRGECSWTTPGGGRGNGTGFIND